MTGDSSILKVENLSKSFGKLIACKNITFSVDEGEIFGIAGPNGAGKTTLFNCISGLYRSSGKVFFRNINISNFSADQVCHIGIARTFQIPLLFNSMSVYQNIKIGAHFGQKKPADEEQDIENILDFLGIKNKKENNVSNLKLLDKKIVMLAAALATKPKMLMLDEPMGGLSPSEIKYFIKIILELKNKLNISMIIIEHLMKILVGLANRLMIIDNGEKICIGLSNDVCKNRDVVKI
ncbi:MAG: ATP-binding cassette domain-containing protein, partial [Actinobacteria bacterium]|nr:ATP-binding cassette domain-containing protein [Actinomycetota bacterium]